MKKTFLVLLVVLFSLTSIFAFDYGFDVSASFTFEDGKPVPTLGFLPYIKNDSSELQLRFNWGQNDKHFKQLTNMSNTDTSNVVYLIDAIADFVNKIETNNEFFRFSVARDNKLDFNHMALGEINMSNLPVLISSDYERMENRFFFEKLDNVVGDKYVTEIAGLQVKYNFTDKLYMITSILASYKINTEDNSGASEIIPSFGMEIPVTEKFLINFAFASSYTKDMLSNKTQRALFETWGAEVGLARLHGNLVTRYKAFVGKGAYYQDAISSIRTVLDKGSYVGFEAAAKYTSEKLSVDAKVAVPFDSTNGWKVKVYEDESYTADQFGLDITVGNHYNLIVSAFAEGIIGRFMDEATVDNILKSTKLFAGFGIKFDKFDAEFGAVHHYGQEDLELSVSAKISAENFFSNY